jgi:hypothetical protein
MNKSVAKKNKTARWFNCKFYGICSGAMREKRGIENVLAFFHVVAIRTNPSTNIYAAKVMLFF